MNKRVLVDTVAAQANLDHASAEAAVDAVVSAISNALAEGDKVAIAGFGTFEARTRAARSGRHPQTGAVITIAASKTPAFKAAPALKQTVNGG